MAPKEGENYGNSSLKKLLEGLRLLLGLNIHCRGLRREI
jgi:hypothetical protein